MRNPLLCVVSSAVLSLLTAPAQCVQINLINGDFEFDSPVASPPTGWTTSTGAMYVVGSGDIGDVSNAYSGNRFVTASRQAPNPDASFPAGQSMGIFQTVDVSDYGGMIDAGNRYAELSFAYNAADLVDIGTVSMQFLNASDSLIGDDLSFVTQQTASGAWETASLLGSVPVGTRSIRFSLLAEQTPSGNGTVRNVSFDALTAQLIDTLPPAPPRDVVHGNLIQFVDNGAWSWFQDERAIVDPQKGKVIVGSMANRGGVGGEGRDGHVQTTHFDLATGERSLYVHNDLESYGGGDDHNVPGLLKKQDGDILQFYAAHNRLVATEDDRSYYRTYDVETETWGPEGEYHWWDAIPDNAPGSGGTTYSNVFQLSAEDPDGDGQGRLYNIARTQQSPHIMYSDDNGVTWQYGGQLTKQNATPPSGNNYVNGYYKYSSNGVDRIDIVATEYHPGDYNNSLYHAYIKDGKLYNSEGAEIDNDVFDAALSYDASKVTSTDDFTKVFQSGASGNSRAWMSDVQRFDDGTIVALFKVRAGGFDSNSSSTSLDHRVWYARFDPTANQWSTTEIAKAGARLFAGEYDYTGLGAINPQDPNTLYISTEVDPITDQSLDHHEIYKGVTADNGATWTWTAITEHSSYDNLRPIVPAWDGENTALLWWRGSMSRSQTYDTAVVGIIDRPVEQYGEVTFVDADGTNTSLADGSPAAFTGPNASTGAADGAWHFRTGVGNNGVLAADEQGEEDAPMLRTTVSGVEPGAYDVFAYFWSDVNQDWQIEAGLSADSLNLFRIRGSQQAEAEHFADAVVVDEGSRSLYRAYLGRTQVAEGDSIQAFIDDSIGSDSARVWYDGLGISRVLSLVSLPGDYNEDGVVDAADYTTWRDNLGNVESLPNDDTPGVGADDLDRWRANYGKTASMQESQTGPGDSVPEPASSAVICIAFAGSVLECGGARVLFRSALDR